MKLFFKPLKSFTDMRTGTLVRSLAASFALLTSLLASQAQAHYGMVIPSDTMVMQDDAKQISLQLAFTHPFELAGMELVKPNKFSVFSGDKETNLLGSLKQKKLFDHTAWMTNYNINRPGLYAFVMEPKPYWEPAEDAFIIHYTKSYVAAFGEDDGWDAELGLKTEIVPLSKPFGLWAGNVFQGIVKLDGKAVPYAEVEVEYYNEDGKSEVPTEYMITQTVKADVNGVFTYAAPKSGWWGFAALNTADYQLKHDGKDKDVELGAVIWVKFQPWTTSE